MTEFNSRLTECLPNLKKYSRTLQKNSHDAEDLIQDTIVKALVNKDKYDPAKPMDKWLCTIMYRLFLDSKKRDKFGTQFDPQKAIDKVHTLPEQENHLQASQCIRMLSGITETRQAVLIYTIFEYGTKEIARMINVPQGTVKSRIRRGREDMHSLAHTFK